MKKRIFWLILSCLMVAVLASSTWAEKKADKKEAFIKAPEKKKGMKKAAMQAREPKYGGTLRVIHQATTVSPSSWDPADVSWLINWYVGLYMENLWLADLFHKGPRATGEYQFKGYEWVPVLGRTGWLATGFEQPDPGTLIIKLRKGVLFPEKKGVMKQREVTADDWVYCFKRFENSPKATSEYFEWIDSYRAVDKYTLELKLNKQFGNWGYQMEWGWSTRLKVYPKEVVEAGIKDWRNANGSGPFRLTNYVSGSSVTYERNPVYWNTTPIGGKEYKMPFVDKLIYMIVPDESTRIAAIKTGKADVMENVSWKYKKALEKSATELHRWRILGSGVQIIAFRNDTPPFDNLKVRRALSLAIDNKAILDSVGGGDGVVYNWPTWVGYPPSVATPFEDLPESTRELFGFNPEKAKKLLTEAGYPDGFTTKLDVSSSSPDYLDIASLVVGYWKDIGIKCVINPMEYSSLHSMMRAGEHKQLLQVGKGTTNPIRVLRIMGMPGFWWNSAKFNDPEYNDLFEQALTASSTEERLPLIRGLQQRMLDQAPYFGLYGAYFYRYAWPWVKNYYGESDTGYFCFAPIWGSVWVDQAQMKKMGR